jgi:serine/threonine protein phosphatase PrpC
MNSQQAARTEPAGSTPGLSLTYGYGTDRGLRRELNEDSFIASDPVFAVADGMGGHEAGEVASGMCVRALAKMPQLATGARTATASVVQQYLAMADDSIRTATGSRAGTTLTGVVVVEQMGIPYWLVMNIGDSRTYRLSQGTLTQVSVDHSEVQELVDSGEITAEQATVHPRRHVVTMIRKPTTGCFRSRRATVSWSARTGLTASSRTTRCWASLARQQTRRKPLTC